MQKRTLRVWDGEHTGDRLNVAGQHRAEYEGPYLERCEPPTAAMKANRPEWKRQRIGLILDAVKGRAAVFRQVVASREDAIPTDLVIGPGHEQAGAYVLDAWSTDPQHADPPEGDASCAVWDFTEREPTEDEKQTLAALRWGPPSNAACLRWQKERERKAKLEEATVRLAEGRGDVAALRARVETVLKVSGMDGKPSNADTLIDEVRKRRRDGDTLIGVCREIAAEDYMTACKTGAARWLRKAVAVAVNNACVRGDNPSKADVRRHADTLRRRYDRAIRAK